MFSKNYIIYFIFSIHIKFEFLVILDFLKRYYFLVLLYNFIKKQDLFEE